MRLVEVEPGKFRVQRPRPRPARSDLSLPNIISDQMPPTEQVDGKFYESKRAFRAVGRSLGLIEIGNEKQKPKTRVNDRAGRQKSIRKAIEKYKAGHRAVSE